MTKIKITKYSDDLKDSLDGFTLSDAATQILRWINTYGGDAVLDIGTDREPYSESEYATLRIKVYREETDEEYAERLRRQESINLTKEQQERALYEQLKAKFGE
jgi:hypothetical protein